MAPGRNGDGDQQDGQDEQDNEIGHGELEPEEQRAQQGAEEGGGDREQGVPRYEEDARQGSAEEVGDRAAELEGRLERAPAEAGQQGLEPSERPAHDAPAEDQVEVDESHRQQRPDGNSPDRRMRPESAEEDHRQNERKAG